MKSEILEKLKDLKLELYAIRINRVYAMVIIEEIRELLEEDE